MKRTFLQQPLDSQEEAFKFLAKQTFCLGIALDEKKYIKTSRKRKEGTTGIMSGFAILMRSLKQSTNLV